MALIDDMKLALRVSSDVYDGEVGMLIDAAIADMRRVGVDGSLLDEQGMDALAKQAVYCYCKANFGYDNDEAARFNASYRQTVADLINSQRDVVA